MLIGLARRHWRPIALGLAVLGLGAVAVIMAMPRPAKHTASVTSKTSRPAAPTATPAPSPPLDPLTIQAIRARSYPGSELTTEQNLGDQGGYYNQIVSYQSDGLKIYALQSIPNGTPPSDGWPVVILNHGYVNPANYQTNSADYQQFIAALARAGFMVVKPDYRGHGRSQGTPEGGHFSPVYTYDVLNLVATLKHTPGVNPSRIGIMGHSLGGHVALRAIVVSKDIKASVLLAGVVGSMYDFFYNWPHSPAPFDQPTTVVQGKRQELVAKYGTPKDNPAFWDSVSAINYVSAVAGPVQVNHDEADSVVPKLFSDHLVAALHQAGKPVDYQVYPGDDHQFTTNRTAVLNNIVSFFKANL
jgi:uncharacterized protein